MFRKVEDGRSKCISCMRGTYRIVFIFMLACEKLPSGLLVVLLINIYLCTKMPFAYDSYISDRLYGGRENYVRKSSRTRTDMSHLSIWTGILKNVFTRRSENYLPSGESPALGNLKRACYMRSVNLKMW